MEKQIIEIRDLRYWLLEQVAGLSIEAFNLIPQGYKNNISWNMGHMVVVQQGICYKKAGLPLMIRQDFSDMFRSGTKPDEFFNEAERHFSEVARH